MKEKTLKMSQGDLEKTQKGEIKLSFINSLQDPEYFTSRILNKKLWPIQSEILKSVREYKKESLLTPLFMLGEVAMEVLIPFLMAKLLDLGIDMGDMQSILRYGLLLIICALLSLCFGILSRRFASIASNGFAKNLRKDLYYKVQVLFLRNLSSLLVF